MAAVWRWREEPYVIAHLVPEKDIKGVFKRDVVLNPGEAVVLIKDGKLEDVVTQTRLEEIGGGLANWWTRWRGHESGTELLFLVTTPIDLDIPLDDRANLTTKDYQKLYGSSTIRFQFLPDNSTKIINLMDHKQLLIKEDLSEKIHNELIATVFSPQLAMYNADEFHGNVNIMKEIETATTIEMRKSFGMWGLHLLKMFTVWDKNTYDELMEYKTQIQNLYEKRKKYTEVQFGEKLNALEKEYKVRKREHERKWDLQFSEIHAEEKMKDIQLESQLKRDTKEHEQDMKEMKDALNIKSELQTQKIQRLKKESEIKMEEKDQDLEFKTKQMEMQIESTEKMLEKGFDSGVVDSKTLQEMMKQQTLQKAVDRGPNKAEMLSKTGDKRSAKKIQDDENEDS